MTEGLKVLFELKKHHYGTLDDFDRKLFIIEKELEVLAIMLKYVDVQENYDDMFPYTIVDKQYVSNRSELLITAQEYRFVKDFIKQNG